MYLMVYSIQVSEYRVLRKIANVNPRVDKHLCWSKLFQIEPIVSARWPALAVEMTTGGRRTGGVETAASVDETGQVNLPAFGNGAANAVDC